MGRSATAPAGVLPGANGPVFEVGDLVYSVEHRDGRVFHRETKRDGSGRASATAEAEVSLVIGSGTRGYSFLFERGEGLFQSPIAWYAQEQKWDLGPRLRAAEPAFRSGDHHRLPVLSRQPGRGGERPPADRPRADDRL